MQMLQNIFNSNHTPQSSEKYGEISWFNFQRQNSPRATDKLCKLCTLRRNICECKFLHFVVIFFFMSFRAGGCKRMYVYFLLTFGQPHRADYINTQLPSLD